MTTLLQRCGNLRAKLEDLAVAKRHVEDVLFIQERSREWRARKEALTKVIAKVSLVAIPATDEAFVASKQRALRSNAEIALTRLQGSEDIKELTRDNAWTRVLNASQGLAEALEDAGRRAWKAHCEQLGILEDHASLSKRTPPTPENDRALQRYQTDYLAYRTIAVRALPESENDLRHIEVHFAACKDAYGQITFNFPPAIKAFFDALSSNTATLANVTPIVLEWLEINGKLEDFHVRREGR
jgi:hypothetical protein